MLSVRAILCLCLAAPLFPQLFERVQVGEGRSNRTTRPVIRGKQYAVTSMEPLAGSWASTAKKQKRQN